MDQQVNYFLCRHEARVWILSTYVKAGQSKAYLQPQGVGVEGQWVGVGWT